MLMVHKMSVINLVRNSVAFKLFMENITKLNDFNKPRISQMIQLIAEAI